MCGFFLTNPINYCNKLKFQMEIAHHKILSLEQTLCFFWFFWRVGAGGIGFLVLLQFLSCRVSVVRVYVVYVKNFIHSVNFESPSDWPTTIYIQLTGHNRRVPININILCIQNNSMDNVFVLFFDASKFILFPKTKHQGQ